MGCGVYWGQIKELERALGVLRPRLDIPGVSDAYQKLYGIRGRLLKEVGVKFPRTLTSLFKLMGLSPGSITIWHDVESGWLAEAREKPGAPPVYHRVSDEVAVKILKKEVTPELEKELLTPDDYLGE
jgi:hypothetical protein